MKNSRLSIFFDKLPFPGGRILTMAISLGALFLTFVISNSAQSFLVKLVLFSLIVLIFLFFHAGSAAGRKITQDKSFVKTSADGLFAPEIVEKLLVLEEANKFFGASLKSNDMFRLVASRAGELVEFETCALFLINKQNKIVSRFAVGKNSRLFTKIRLNYGKGLAGRAILSREVESDNDLKIEKKHLPKEFLDEFGSAAALPLSSDGEVFAVLNFYSRRPNFFDRNKKILLEAVGERIAPLLKGAFAFEISLSNALTDSLTNLPNERAFYLVLENQIAEAQRSPENRNLTILAVDIRDFTELNQKYGHSTGDRILAFTADLIKEQLREMDFLARSRNDEFMVILPTAPKEIASKVISRINEAFAAEPFEFAENSKKTIELNFGAATFFEDGETSDSLYQSAIMRKRTSKAAENGAVLMFPREYIN